MIVTFKANYFLIVSVLLTISCTEQKPQLKPTLESALASDTNVLLQDTIAKSAQAVLGYRFSIKGDFDGDGNIEELMEHFIDGKTGKETNKFYSGISYEELVERTVAKTPNSFASCSNSDIDTLHFARQDQLLGLSYLKNEGDLNGDGADEISYVVNWADWSNINTCHIVSFVAGKWKNLYSFPIRDWQLPDLPETKSEYDPMGLKNKQPISESDEQEGLLHTFEGLIKPITPNVIEVIYMNEEAMTDTMQVQLPPAPNGN